MTKQTWLGLPDQPDVPNPPCDLEAMQEERMKAALGLTLWAWLEKMEGKE